MISKKVVVAMSGGVDSSVAAALLKNKGYSVAGVFLRFWQEKCVSSSENKCCSLESLQRAKKVAKILNIPFYVYDYRKEFKKQVVDYFIQEYSRGSTPNPCIICNKKIKLGFLFDKINALGFDFLATGHYVKKLKIKNKKLKIEYRLFRARDESKDQSYFLYNLNQDKLKKLLFPIGDYRKEEVRKLARKYKLPTAATKESQDVCFLPKEGLEEFLKRYIDNIKPGVIVNTKGKVVGKHHGLSFYTIGQRKGIKIGGGKPYYVAGTNIKENKLIVTDNPKDKNLYTKQFEIYNVNWILGEKSGFPLEVDCQVRYRQKAVRAIILKYNESNQACLVDFKKPQRAVTSGQSAVFYKEQEMLGGGIIK